MGANSSGRLGDGTIEDRINPVKIFDSGVKSAKAGTLHSLILMDDGSLWATGQNQDGQLGDGSTEYKLKPVKIANNITKIAAGSVHSLMVQQMEILKVLVLIVPDNSV